jgi:hypothetical protein
MVMKQSPLPGWGGKQVKQVSNYIVINIDIIQLKKNISEEMLKM